MKTITFLVKVTLPFEPYTDKTTIAEFMKCERDNIRTGILATNHKAKINIDTAELPVNKK